MPFLACSERLTINPYSYNYIKGCRAQVGFEHSLQDPLNLISYLSSKFGVLDISSPSFRDGINSSRVHMKICGPC